jgi:hypothetical protein
VLNANNVISIAYFGGEFVQLISSHNKAELWHATASIIIGSGLVMSIYPSTKVKIVTFHTNLATKTLSMSYDEFVHRLSAV